MNICFDAKRYFYNRTGLGNYSRFVVEGLKKHCAENEYFLYDARHPQAAPLQGFNGFLAKKMPSIWRSYFIKNALNYDNIDIFHGLSNEIPLVLPKRTKSVVTIHDLIFLRYPHTYNPIDALIYKKKVGYALKKSDKIVATSEQTKQDIVHFFGTAPQKIDVVYQSCHAQFSQVLPPEVLRQTKQKYGLHKPFLLCVGSIATRKNQLNLVKAMHKLNVGNEVDLVLLGNKTAYQLEVERYVAAQKMPNIKIFNAVEFADFPAFYQLCIGVVNPSIFEGFGIPILEAMASRVPVLVSGISSFPEVLGDLGNKNLYFNPYDVEEMASKIDFLLKNRHNKALFTRHFEAQLLQFDGELLAKKMNNLYLNI